MKTVTTGRIGFYSYPGGSCCNNRIRSCCIETERPTQAICVLPGTELAFALISGSGGILRQAECGPRSIPNVSQIEPAGCAVSLAIALDRSRLRLRANRLDARGRIDGIFQ